MIRIKDLRDRIMAIKHITFFLCQLDIEPYTLAGLAKREGFLVGVFLPT